jgi:CHAT domain-containing protein/tetratricopeptide (TPR) repeat protein
VTFRRITLVPLFLTFLILAGFTSLGVPPTQEDPSEILKEADRLAWLKNWSRAEPLFARAEQLFLDSGDQRNALYAMVGKLRGQLPRLSNQQASNQLSDLLGNPLVATDTQLRLRVLTVKGDTDMDIDVDLAQRDWSEVLALSKRLGDKPWEARATGELGIIDFMQGNTTEAMLKVSTAIDSARQTHDFGSLVRYLTLTGSALAQNGNASMGLSMLDSALAIAGQNRDLSNPVMTYTEKARALAALNRAAEADQLLETALATAKEVGSLGYQAELLGQMGAMANRVGNSRLAIQSLQEAVNLAERVNGHGQVAESSVELSKIYLAAGDLEHAERSAQASLDAVRLAGDKFNLPVHLTQLANVKTARAQYTEAAALYEEAMDVLNAQLIHASSPANKASRIGVMDAVYIGYFRLAATNLNDLNRAFTVVEQARGRSLADLIAVRENIPTEHPAQMTELEKRISALQIDLMKPQSRDQRKRTLVELLTTEWSLAPIVAAANRPWMEAQLQPISIRELQNHLHQDELLLEFVLDDPTSFCVVISRDSARLQRLGGGSGITMKSEALLSAIRDRRDFEVTAKDLYMSVLSPIQEIHNKTKLIVVPDGVLHRLPLEVLINSTGKKVLDTHTVTYVPSSNVLALLRRPGKPAKDPLPLLAVSSSPEGTAQQSKLGPVQRGIFDLDGVQIPPLPAANDEVKSVAQTFGKRSVVVFGEQAKESNIKAQPLDRFQVLHFAVHGLLSTTYPERSALVFQADPASGEDGLLQAREISQLRLNADLVTLSACDTGSGKIKGQEGVAALVRPFIIAGAKSVVANLWQADDEFTLALMREFYRRLATGANKATALRDAKLELIKKFGSQAPPLLWAGFIIVGEGSNSLMSAGGAKP